MARGRDGLERVETAIGKLAAAIAAGDPATARAAAALRTELMLAEQEQQAWGAALESLRIRAEAMLERA